MELLCLHTGFFNPSENTPEWNSCAYILASVFYLIGTGKEYMASSKLVEKCLMEGLQPVLIPRQLM